MAGGRAITFQQTAAGTVSWTVDSDCEVVGFCSTVQSAVTRQPNATNASIFAPAAAGIDKNIIAQSGAAAASSAKFVVVPNIPLYEDEVIVITFAALGNSTIFLVDAIH